jgi:subtilisin family serine protease
MATIPKFRYAPPDRRSEEEASDQRAVVREQIVPWVEELTGGGRKVSQAEAMKLLRRRRDGAGVTAFEVDDDEFPVATYRLLVRKEDADDVAKYLGAKFAPQVVSIPGLDGVRVLQDIGAGARRLRCSGAVARTVAKRRAVPSYVALMGAVRKAVGGPEPAPPPNGEFSEALGSAVPGSGPSVMIIDNGVSAEVRADGWLAGLARTDNLDLLNVVPLDNYLDLGAGHGTFTAGIVQQVAPGVRLDVRRGLDTEGVGDELDIGREIVRAAADDAEIINLSLGLVTTDDEPPFGLEAAIRTAIDIAEEKGTHLLLVCAAGNYGDERPCWPAAFCKEPGFEDHVISVAALRRDYDDPTQVVGAEWSTHGDRVNISTFGQGVVSTYVVGTESPKTDPLDADTFGPSSWAIWSGTSFAAPQVTGAIVRIMQENGVRTAYQAFEELKKLGSDVIDGYGTSIEILPV